MFTSIFIIEAYKLLAMFLPLLYKYLTFWYAHEHVQEHEYLLLLFFR